MNPETDIETQATADPTEPATTDTEAPDTTETDNTDAENPALLKAKLERQTGEAIKYRKRAQAAEAALTQLQAESVSWQTDAIAASFLMDAVAPAARHDVATQLTPEQLKQLYAASRIPPDKVKAAYTPHARRSYVAANRPDSVVMAVSNAPDMVAIREQVDAAKAIISAAIAGKPYMQARRGSTPDLAATVRRLNSPQTTTPPKGNPLAQAIMRH